MSKKRIAIFGVKYFPAKGGTSRVVENLLLELKDYYDITIYCYQHEAAAKHIDGIKTIQFPEIKIKGFGVFLYFLRCCWHIMWSNNFDLVHLHKTDGAFFLPILSLKYKLIATSHALPYLNEKWSWLGKAYFHFVEKRFMHSKAHLTAISKPQTEYYYKKYQRQVQFIPNGIHPVKRIDPHLADDVLKQHGVDDGYLFFAARRVIPLKGCHTLLKALNQINYKGTLVIAGDMDQLPEYSKELHSLAKGLDVKFIGYVNGMDRLNALLHRAKFFVFPSELEGMSMMLLEAGCIGTPIICSDIPQNKAVLSEKEVLYFKSKSVENLAKKLVWAFEHENEMQKTAVQTKRLIESKYLISEVVQEYIDMYENILSNQKLIPSPR